MLQKNLHSGILGISIGICLTAMAFPTMAAPAQSQAKNETPVLPADLQKVRAALDKYRDPIAAVRDGYFSTLGCIEYPNPARAGEAPYAPGGMGLHFLNARLISPHPDPLHPAVLIYEPVGDKLQLAAAEYFVPLATGVKGHPQLFGHPFDGPMQGHYPIMPLSMTHYDLHVWLWKPNPSGLFSGTNPNLKCPAGGYTFKDEAPKITSAP